MKNKYSLLRLESLFLAKKTLAENIYYAAKMEGVNVNFPQTKTMLEGVCVGGLAMDDVQKILNLRNAWRFVLNNLDQPLNLAFVKKINLFISYGECMEAGSLRYGKVEMLPASVENKVISEMNQILSIPNVTERALKFMLWAMRWQLFTDGNESTCIISANKILIENGKGIVAIEEKNLEEFNERLSKFYETNEYNHIIHFLYDKCIFGIDYK